MPRKAGSKNLPVTADKAVARLREIAKEQGLSLTEYLTDMDKTDADKLIADATKDGDKDKKQTKKLDLSGNLFNQESNDDDDGDDDDDVYGCGSCDYESDSEFDKCPECGKGMSW